jgi:hypothetical protein
MKRKIYNDVYMQDFYLVVGRADYGKRPHDCRGWTTSAEDGIYIYLSHDATVRDLAHEVDHAISYLWDERSIDKQTIDEAYAYMIGWLFKECYKKLNLWKT